MWSDASSIHRTLAFPAKDLTQVSLTITGFCRLFGVMRPRANCLLSVETLLISWLIERSSILGTMCPFLAADSFLDSISVVQCL